MEQPFEQVVDRHGETVLRVCRAVLGPNPEADDAWSETFLAALKAWPQLSEDANVQAWLVTIAHRKAVDVVRARARHAVPTDELPEPEPALGASEASEKGDPDLWAAVKALPDKQRQVVAYRYLGGLTYRDIAEIVGGSADSARRAAADGVKTLRRLYEPGDERGPRTQRQGAVR